MSEKNIIKFVGTDIYQYDSLILSDVNIEINKGEFIYITGKVGTGKSSLIKTINAELPLIKGTGKVAEYDLHKLKRKEIPGLRRKLGVVFQDFRLLPGMNIFQNLQFVLKATGWKNKQEISKRIEQVLMKVGMTDKKQNMPHQLSGGEQQRIVIARAILNNPPVILADEPTGNLDPETSADIMNLFLELNKEGKTIIMVTHDFAAIAGMPARTLVCANGMVSDSAKDNVMIDFEKLLGF